MNETRQTHLDRLMREFNVSGHSLAATLNVDNSLVSKWRNGKRALSSRSDYLDRIVKHFLLLDAGRQYARLRLLLAPVYPQSSLETKQEIAPLLARYLVDVNLDGPPETLPLKDYLGRQNVARHEVYSFAGNEGKRQALQVYLDMALADVSHTEILAFASEASGWFSEDEDFLREWQKKNLDFLNHGGRIEVVQAIDREFRSIALSLIRWLPLHMHAGCQPYLYPLSAASSAKFTIFLLKGKLAMFGASVAGNPAPPRTFISDSGAVVAKLEEIYQYVRANSQPLYQKFLPANRAEMLSVFLSTMANSAASYCYALSAIAGVVSSELLRGILLDNQLDQAAIDTCLKEHKSMRESFVCTATMLPVRYFIPYDALRQALASKSIFHPTFSIFAGTPIFVSSRRYAQYFQELAAALDQFANFEVSLMAASMLDGIENVELLVRKYDVIFGKSQAPFNFEGDAPFAILTSEPTTVNCMYQSLERIWQSTTPLLYDKNWVKEQLHGMREKILSEPAPE